ncbi:hypothetical protein PAPYR_10213 [Paratrimastix pyriformis]|uniref:Uncharacterized protein n=1 Tax=Paratrimastix pyriformis TaxID=342808 RepID=A0ABQ8UCA5_9EUKA|nr:hypothetical protein PAPYR_10213 [Paratrimastix pyriformis]
MKVLSEQKDEFLSKMNTLQSKMEKKTDEAVRFWILFGGAFLVLLVHLYCWRRDSVLMGEHRSELYQEHRLYSILTPSRYSSLGWVCVYALRLASILASTQEGKFPILHTHIQRTFLRRVLASTLQMGSMFWKGHGLMSLGLGVDLLQIGLSLWDLMEITNAIHGINLTAHLFHQQGTLWWNRNIAEFTNPEYALAKATISINTSWLLWNFLSDSTYWLFFHLGPVLGTLGSLLGMFGVLGIHLYGTMNTGDLWSIIVTLWVLVAILARGVRDRIPASLISGTFGLTLFLEFAGSAIGMTYTFYQKPMLRRMAAMPAKYLRSKVKADQKRKYAQKARRQMEK